MDTPKTILVIDDDKKFSFGLVAVLRREGFQVMNVGSGAEGISTIRETKPDCILCDIMMPPPNGFQLKKELAKDSQLGQIPFMFLTARTAQMDKLAGLDNGADDYITKPFEVSELIARIKSILRREEQGYQRGIQESQAGMDKLRSTISSNLSHEMRTPLTVLLPTLELLIHDKFAESSTEVSQYVNSAISSAHRIKFLVEDLEMLYDLDQGMINTFRQLVDLNFHFKTPIMQTLKTWEHKKQYVQLNINRDLVIHAPSVKFAHVVAHLMDNACKFGPENGKILISISPNGIGGCTLDVTDEGEGIPVELREKVFDRYYQISQGDTRAFGGLGVGLTIARAYARAWGGDIRIGDSYLGCRVQLVLPPSSLN